MIVLLALAGLLLGASASSSGAQETGDKPADADPVWTDKPVRVDRKKQTFERLQAEKPLLPLQIKVTTRVKVIDSASFVLENINYVLTGAIPVGPRRLCRAGDGSTTACGRQARVYLHRLIAGHTLHCREDFRTTATRFVSCTLADKDLTGLLVEKGAAWSAMPRYQVQQDKAMAAARGIWTDVECLRVGRCLTGRKRR